MYLQPLTQLKQNRAFCLETWKLMSMRTTWLRHSFLVALSQSLRRSAHLHSHSSLRFVNGFHPRTTILLHCNNLLQQIIQRVQLFITFKPTMPKFLCQSSLAHSAVSKLQNASLLSGICPTGNYL